MLGHGAGIGYTGPIDNFSLVTGSNSAKAYINISYSRATSWLGFEGHAFTGHATEDIFQKWTF